MNNTTDLTPLTPQELEEAVICTLLGQPSSITEVAATLTPDMFLSPVTALIYSAMLARYNRGELPDYLTIEAEMRQIDNRLFEECGGIGALGNALHQLRHTANLPAYVEEVKRYYLLRTLKALFNSLAAEASIATTDPVSLVEKATRKQEEIYGEIRLNIQAKHISPIARELIEEYRETLASPQKKAEKSIPTGLYTLDLLTGGIREKELYILAGRPGDGKTAIALQIAWNVAMSGFKTGYFSLEMDKKHVGERFFTAYTGIDSFRMRSYNLYGSDLDKMEQTATQWEEWPFYLDDNPDHTVESIRAQVLMAAQKEKYKLIVIDYLHLLTRQCRPGENPNTVITETVRSLKKLAMQAGCAILLLSQLNRESEKRTEKYFKPILADLRDSGAIEQDADMAFFIYRPDRHNITTDPITGQDLRGICQLMLLKNRHGITGTVNLYHNESFSRFTSQPPEGGISSFPS